MDGENQNEAPNLDQPTVAPSGDTEKADLPYVSDTEKKEADKKREEKATAIQADADKKREEMAAAIQNPQEDNEEATEDEEITSQTPADAKFDVKGDTEKLEQMPFGELLQELFSRGGLLISSFENFNLESLGEIFTGAKKYTKEELENVTPETIDDPNLEEFNTEADKSVQLVAKYAGLPPRKTIKAFLTSLIASKLEYVKNSNRFNEMSQGDILFFQKEGKEEPYLTAFVYAASEDGDTTIKYFENGEIKEVTPFDETSELWGDFSGFIKRTPDTEEPDSTT